VATADLIPAGIGRAESRGPGLGPSEGGGPEASALSTVRSACACGATGADVSVGFCRGSGGEEIDASSDLLEAGGVRIAVPVALALRGDAVVAADDGRIRRWALATAAAATAGFDPFW